MRQREIESQVEDIAESVSRATDGIGRVRSLFARGRELGSRLGRHGGRYGQELVTRAEDLADHANYGYRRVRRQVTRHPVATAAIVAGTIGAVLLLRHALRKRR